MSTCETDGYDKIMVQLLSIFFKLQKTESHTCNCDLERCPRRQTGRSRFGLVPDWFLANIRTSLRRHRTHVGRYSSHQHSLSK